MGKKNGRKEKRLKERDGAKPKPETPAPPDGEDDGLDLGGLPDRDLKKNLGCG